MKIIFDTNVILSAFLTHGLSAHVLDVSIDYHNLYTSQWIIDEVSSKLKNKFKVSLKDLNRALGFIKNVFKIVNPTGSIPAICRDKDDNNILHLAEFINADLIITGDKDLLVLNKYQNTIIITPREYMEKYHKK